MGSKCRFFQWRDNEICDRGKVFVPQQRQRVITLEAEVASYKKREKFLVVAMALLVVMCVVLCWLGNVCSVGGVNVSRVVYRVGSVNEIGVSKLLLCLSTIYCVQATNATTGVCCYC